MQQDAVRTDDDTIEGEARLMSSGTGGVTNAPPAVRRVGSLAAEETWTPSFAVQIDEMKRRVEMKHQFFSDVMREGQHYGVIPGTSTKPTLLKPGAELLLSSMGLYAEFIDAELPQRDYETTADHEGLIFYRRACLIYRQDREGNRILVARAEGSCNSREVKYRYRINSRRCPVCKNETIIKGREDYGGGWLCFVKKGGCGAKFKDGDAVIESQEVGRVPNPDLADLDNTILKMADKRALVASTLIATGCSDIFTQDLEDMEPTATETAAPPSSAPAPFSPTEFSNGIVQAFKDKPAMPREVFVGFMREHLGQETFKGVADEAKLRALRAAVDAWVPHQPPPSSGDTLAAAPAVAAPASGLSEFDGDAFVRLVPDPANRTALIERIDPEAMTFDDLSPSSRERLAALVAERTEPAAQPA